MTGGDNTKQDLHKTVERLTREIVQCQNAIEAGRPCYGTPNSHIEWLSKLQGELAEAEMQLTQLHEAQEREI
jgi:hypothetical protein